MKALRADAKACFGKSGHRKVNMEKLNKAIE